MAEDVFLQKDGTVEMVWHSPRGIYAIRQKLESSNHIERHFKGLGRIERKCFYCNGGISKANHCHRPNAFRSLMIMLLVPTPFLHVSQLIQPPQPRIFPVLQGRQPTRLHINAILSLSTSIDNLPRNLREHDLAIPIPLSNPMQQILHILR